MRRGGLAFVASFPAALLCVLGLRAWDLPLDPGVPTCPFRTITRLPCPGCGMTRALVQLAHGHWDAALSAQPLVLLLAVEVLVAWAWWGFVLAGRASPPDPRLRKILLRANLAILAGAWLVRLLGGTLR